MAIPAKWQTSLDTIRQQMDKMEKTADGWTVPEALRTALTLAKAEGWKNEQQVYVFGQVDTEKYAVLAREGLATWWPAFNGRAYFGDRAGVEALHDAFEADAGKSEKPNLHSSMTWVAHPYALEGGELHQPDAGILRQLLEWGADPSYEDGKYYAKGLREAEEDVIRAFLDHGASTKTADAVTAELLKAKNFRQATRIRSARGLGAYYTKMDNDTLMETSYAAEPGGDSVFRRVFNFRAQRVNEIFETLGKDGRMTMTSVDFTGYGVDELRAAQEKLESLGGRPADPFNKPRLKAGATHGA